MSEKNRFELPKPILTTEAKKKLLDCLDNFDKVSTYFERWESTKLEGLEEGSFYYEHAMNHREVCWKILHLLKERLQEETTLHGPGKKIPFIFRGIL